uniref:Putative secreted protein n=1 Tax=Ixodes ricinus TaxID=34613 RepID=A0A6B0U815_IXORI
MGARTLMELVVPWELPWTAVALSTYSSPTWPRRLNSSECHSPRLYVSVVVSSPDPVPQLNITFSLPCFMKMEIKSTWLVLPT